MKHKLTYINKYTLYLWYQNFRRRAIRKKKSKQAEVGEQVMIKKVEKHGLTGTFSFFLQLSWYYLVWTNIYIELIKEEHAIKSQDMPLIFTMKHKVLHHSHLGVTWRSELQILWPPSDLINSVFLWLAEASAFHYMRHTSITMPPHGNKSRLIGFNLV